MQMPSKHPNHDTARTRWSEAQDLQARQAPRTPDPQRTEAVRQLIARSVLHGPALRVLLATGR